MNKFGWLIILLLLIVPVEAAEQFGGSFVNFPENAGICVGEADGDPNVATNCGITGLIFDGADVTINGDGTATISITGGGATNSFLLLEDDSSYLLLEDDTSKLILN